MKTCVGSPLYMAPQVLSRKQYKSVSDLWSLGVVLHEMIYNDVPWKGRDEADLLNNIKKIPYKIRPGLSKLSEEFLKGALVYDEDKRMTWD